MRYGGNVWVLAVALDCGMTDSVWVLAVDSVADSVADSAVGGIRLWGLGWGLGCMGCAVETAGGRGSADSATYFQYGGRTGDIVGIYTNHNTGTP